VQDDEQTEPNYGDDDRQHREKTSMPP
jgi:hypothetical protein